MFTVYIVYYVVQVFGRYIEGTDIGCSVIDELKQASQVYCSYFPTAAFIAIRTRKIQIHTCTYMFIN